jgi:hypothetical protein
MKLTTLISALITTTVFVSASQASTILVDDFNAPAVRVLVSDTTLGGAVTSTSTTSSFSLANSRQVSVDLTVANTPDAEIRATVGGAAGYLNYSVSTGDNGIGKVTWTLPTFTLPSGDNGFSFAVIASALGSFGNAGVPNNIAFNFTGSSAANSFALSTDVSAYQFANPGTALNIALSAVQSLALTSGGQLELVFTGGQGWNLALDQFAINSTPGTVPVPASAALFGIALVAMRLVGKKSVARKA